MLFIDHDVPEDDAHIISLWLPKGENQSVREVAPHVFGLNVRKENVGVHCQCDSESEPLPANRIDHASI